MSVTNEVIEAKLKKEETREELAKRVSDVDVQLVKVEEQEQEQLQILKNQYEQQVQALKQQFDLQRQLLNLQRVNLMDLKKDLSMDSKEESKTPSETIEIKKDESKTPSETIETKKDELRRDDKTIQDSLRTLQNDSAFQEAIASHALGDLESKVDACEPTDTEKRSLLATLVFLFLREEENHVFKPDNTDVTLQGLNTVYFESKLTFLPMTLPVTTPLRSAPSKPGGKPPMVISEPSLLPEEYKDQLETRIEKCKDLKKQLVDITAKVLKEGTITWDSSKSRVMTILKDTLDKNQNFVSSAEVLTKEHKKFQANVMLKHKKEIERHVSDSKKHGIQWPHAPEVRRKLEEAGFRHSPTILRRDRCECPECHAETADYQPHFDLPKFHKPNCKHRK